MGATYGSSRNFRRSLRECNSPLCLAKYLTDGRSGARLLTMNRPMRHPTNEPIALHDRAIDDLRFIRRTMERAGSFTAVPGWGGVGIGAIGLTAALFASRQDTAGGWLAVWLAAAVVATGVAVGTMARKARQAQVTLHTGPGRKFLLSFLPSVAAAAALTAALYARDATALLPGVWLLSYGAAMISAGSFSVRVVPLMGMAFMLLGGLALATPAAWADAWMAAGFGGLHVAFGILIARRYGG